MPFPIEEALKKVRQVVKKREEPVVHHYRETPFTVLISCLLSLRTQDRTTDAASERLFALARSPKAMRTLDVKTIEQAIYPVGFYRTKAKTILMICGILEEKFGGEVPKTLEELLELPGVGRKTANLVLTLGHNLQGICVDTHVHRIVNRWDYVRTTTPDETELTLRRKLPSRWWIPLNGWLVSFGQTMCQPISPLCSKCPVRPICPRRGVTYSR